MRIPLRKIDLSFANVIKDMLMSGIQSGIDVTFSTLTRVFNFEILVDDSTIEVDSVNNHLQIKTDGVQNSHLNSNCAGSGLTQDVNGALKVSITYNSAEIDENGLQGQPVYIKNTGHIARAKATNGYQNFVGLLTDNSTSGNSVEYQTSGKFTMNDWTNVTGTTLLTPQNIYYLSDTDFGLLTDNPSTLTEYCVKIGIALSTTSLEIDNDINILL